MSGLIQNDSSTQKAVFKRTYFTTLECPKVHWEHTKVSQIKFPESQKKCLKQHSLL